MGEGRFRAAGRPCRVSRSGAEELDQRVERRVGRLGHQRVAREPSTSDVLRRRFSPASVCAARGGVIDVALAEDEAAPGTSLRGAPSPCVVVARLEVVVAARRARAARGAPACRRTSTCPGSGLPPSGTCARVAPDGVHVEGRRGRSCAPRRGTPRRLSSGRRRRSARCARRAPGWRAAHSSATSAPMEWPTMLRLSIFDGSQDAEDPVGHRRDRWRAAAPRERPCPGRSSASTLQPW